MRGQPGGDRLAKSIQQLRVLRVFARGQVTGYQLPVLGLERDLTTAPGQAPDFRRRLEQRELVGPGREPAGAAKVVQMGEHGDAGVVSSLLGEIDDIRLAQARELTAAA